MYLVGILQALGIVFFDTLYNIYIKFVGINFEIKAMTFPFYYLIGNALTMMIVAGPGRFALDTVKNISTWIYGVAYLLSFVVEIYLVKYVSSTELSILLRLTVPVCMLLAFIFNKRRPNKHDMISLSVITISLFAVLIMQESNYLMPVLWLCLALAFLESMGYFIPENHSTNEKAIKESGLRGQMRVISFATFVTSSMMFVLLILFCLFDNDLGLTKLLGLPTDFVKLSDFVHFPTVVSGLIFGCFLAPFMRFFQWSASYKITSETVLNIMAIIPFITFSFEWMLVSTGIQPSSPLFESNKIYILLMISVFMAIGTWYSAYLKSADKLKKIEGNNLFEKIKNVIKLKNSMIGIGFSANIMPDYEVVKITLDFCGQDFKQASGLLKVPEDTLRTLYYGESNYSLRPEHSKRLHEQFRNKVFFLDQLTKIENRKGFEIYFNQLKLDGVNFTLYYMDLNKFKLINDTYNHNVGDEVLIGVAKALDTFVISKKGKAFRLSGDEFAFIIPKTNILEEDFKRQLKKAIEKPIKVTETNKIDHITPSISVGSSDVLVGVDVKIKDILKSADEQMYDEKRMTHAKN